MKAEGNLSSPTFVPCRQVDQTLVSVLALTWVENGIAPSKYLNQVCGQWRLPYETSFPGQLSVLSDWLSIKGSSSTDQLIRDHSYAAILEPFISPAEFVRLKLYMVGNHPLRNRHCFPTQLIREEGKAVRYCPGGIRDDLGNFGFSYARRLHQVIGVQICPHHALQVGVVVAKSDDSLARYGVILDESPALRGGKPIGNVDKRPEVWINFANWVFRVLTGRIGRKECEHSAPRILAALGSAAGNQHQASTALREVISSTFGAEAMDLVRTRHGPAGERWPSLFVDGEAFRDHAVANLLMLSALVPDPAGFA